MIHPSKTTACVHCECLQRNRTKALCQPKEGPTAYRLSSGTPTYDNAIRVVQLTRSRRRRLLLQARNHVATKSELARANPGLFLGPKQKASTKAQGVQAHGYPQLPFYCQIN